MTTTADGSIPAGHEVQAEVPAAEVYLPAAMEMFAATRTKYKLVFAGHEVHAMTADIFK